MASMRSMVHPKYKTQYRVRNWSTYDRALVRRGDLTIWFTPEAIDAWEPRSTGRRGAQRKYSDLAIGAALTLRLVFSLPLRQTEGLLNSILNMMTSRSRRRITRLCRDVPGISTSHFARVRKTKRSTWWSTAPGSRSSAKASGQPRNTEVAENVAGEVHLGVDAAGVIAAVELTENTTDDASVVPDLLGQVEGDIARFTADGAYDTSAVYDSLTTLGAIAVIPPSSAAVVSGRNDVGSRARDATVKSVHEVGRRRWKKESEYHRQGRGGEHLLPVQADLRWPRFMLGIVSRKGARRDLLAAS